MTKPLLEMTPSFVSRIIRQSRQLKSEAEVLSAYQKLAAKKDIILDEEDALEALPNEKELLSKNIPDQLRPFAEALFGAISIKDDEQSPDPS